MPTREKFKTGDTVKLVYPFNSSAILEVYTSYGKWHRVTAREFRSFDGPRRINDYASVEDFKAINGAREVKEYDGPLYYYGTNTAAEFTDSRQILHLET